MAAAESVAARVAAPPRLVIGGPAEAWRYNENGLPVGIESGRPTLQLDDFVTVLRTFSPSGTNIFNCLIVPRQEGLKQIKEFVAQSNARGPLRPTAVRNWVKQLQEKLGLQDVEVNGVPADSRAARDTSLPEEHLDESVLRHVRALNEIAQERGQKLAQMALQWALRDKRVTSVVVGASSVEQLDINLDALQGPAFSEEELARIDQYAVDAGINLWAEQTKD